MQIILLERIPNLGNLGDTVKVKSGYARNFLIPKGKATAATPANIATFEGRRAELEQRASAEIDVAKSRAAKLDGQTITLTANAGPEGKLFGSIGTLDIAEACAALGVEVERSEVRLTDGPIRMLGTHEVELHLHTDVSAKVTVVVESSEPIAAAQ